jgi:hypothetical protein
LSTTLPLVAVVSPLKPLNSSPITHFTSTAHTWREYSSKSDPNAPLIDGVSMGSYHDGSPLFVARYKYSKKHYEPAYININGAYSNEGNNETLVRYLVMNPDLEYTWRSIRPEDFYENAVLINEELPVARVNLTDKQGRAFSVLASLTLSKTAVYYDPIDDYYGTTAKAPVEILTCTAKGVEEDFAVTTRVYRKKQLCCESEMKNFLRLSE